MTTAKRRRLRIGLLVAIAAGTLSFGLEGADKQARSDEAAPPATPKPRPIPKAGPLAQPKSLQQIGLPTDATREAIPPDNPQTPEKIALGEKLFFDGRLSADGTVACGTCHDPARAFTDGRPTSIGVNDRVGQRNAPTILNALYNKDAILGRPGRNARGAGGAADHQPGRNGPAQHGRCRRSDRGDR